MNTIKKYFPELTAQQLNKFELLFSLYAQWNEKINVISRKDMDNFFERHVLHSLAIAKINSFENKSIVLDIGTGGGFPGIPLAIYFPEVTFILTDSVAKKITVVNEVVKALDLKNVSTKIERAENINLNVDYVVTRAVAKMSDLIFWSKNKNPKKIIALKGGDLKDELNNIKKNIRIIDIHEFYSEEFFETKKIVICS
ncbi:MAG TPA: 16S rRNA (guanine(527)-N(7))-methyltransferase RsmG [Chitinophagales bacterium]|jgi:16S rRNA (guanine527-N7)-methyltransferase|nr:16S rRNA (guanine(527)-N(7))-methyltransferase RsmG [Chitinophagales bacterium]MBP6153429.1 16S rRNA (guanine(527)-N(7))-methyltransferase RsmG [Chitinophagales bacterium]HQV79156.1 16S rRNA (guanine(527)-N(7))-methyltransferase RsmG [Chitinophagales bacterium]HQW79888.1 16S rRNA (guanine(527)-N(7))-methyltransferase RsmG [Chitinophagales bacterium]HRB67454.1 16S rRNA (guanine(527)-N(7))-methyltransferase RsmG [Chitinophagales bacterium]